MIAPRLTDYLSDLILAIDEEIEEGRSHRKVFTLGRGSRVATASSRPLYFFPVANPPRLQEETRGRLIVGEVEVDCIAINRRDDGIDVATFSDLGEEIQAASLTIDRSDILGVLAARLIALRDGTASLPFNAELVEEALDAVSGPSEAASGFIATPEDLTEDQKEAFRKVFRNRVSYLWGPPGTGKTTTLSAIAAQLFREHKRVLVVSHTNQAVDGVLRALCRRVVGKARLSLPEGSIVRLGAISRRTLEGEFGDQIGVERVSDAYQKKLGSLREGAAREVETNQTELNEARELLQVATSQEALTDELRDLTELLKRARSSEGSLRAILRVLRVKYPSSTQDGGSVDDIKASIRSVQSRLFDAATRLNGEDVASLELRVEDLAARDRELREALSDLEHLGRDAYAAVIQRARVVACTATQALLRVSTLKEFDVVLVDEASMIPLPLAVFLSGLGRERLVLGGDFRQLPPVSLSPSERVKKSFARDIFEASGLIELLDAGEQRDTIAVLSTQFRGTPGLSSLINNRFYGGRLNPKAPSAQALQGERRPPWLPPGSIGIVDTSSLHPIGHRSERSKGNLIHAIVAREVCRLLKADGLINGSSDLGVIAPYRPQVALIDELLKESQIEPVSVGTVHRFQGAEREIVVLDLTESEPHTLGSFLSARSPREIGARLLNVALTRANSYLILIANLTYLNERLTEEHLLAGILRDSREHGGIVSAEDILSHAESLDKRSLAAPTSSSQPTQLFQGGEVLAGIAADLKNAKSSLVVASPCVGEQSSSFFAEELRSLIARGVSCEVVIPRALPNSHPEQIASLDLLSSLGVVVTPLDTEVRGGLVIDHEVVWCGASNLLNLLETSAPRFLRAVSPVLAATLLAAHETHGAAPGASRVANL